MRPPDNWNQARATLAIAAVTFIAWLLAMGAGAEDYVAIWGGFIPLRVAEMASGTTLPPVALTPLTVRRRPGLWAAVCVETPSS